MALSLSGSVGYNPRKTRGILSRGAEAGLGLQKLAPTPLPTGIDPRLAEIQANTEKQLADIDKKIAELNVQSSQPTTNKSLLNTPVEPTEAGVPQLYEGGGGGPSGSHGSGSGDFGALDGSVAGPGDPGEGNLFSLADMGLSPGEMASTVGSVTANVGKGGLALASLLAGNPFAAISAYQAGKGIFSTLGKSTETLLDNMENTGAIVGEGDQDTGVALANDFAAIEASQDAQASMGIPAGEAIDAGNVGMGVSGGSGGIGGGVAGGGYAGPGASSGVSALSTSSGYDGSSGYGGPGGSFGEGGMGFGNASDDAGGGLSAGDAGGGGGGGK